MPHMNNTYEQQPEARIYHFLKYSNLLLEDINVLKLKSQGLMTQNTNPVFVKSLMNAYGTFVNVRRKAPNKHLSGVAFYSFPILTSSGRT